MKKVHIVLIAVVIVLLAIVGVFLYERAHASLYLDEDAGTVTIIGGAEAPTELPDKNQIIYIYCRSGNRSKQAADKLVALGYTNIIEFGGIIDWDGEVEK